MRTDTAVVAGIRMRWQDRGHGPAVVLVHGIPTSPRLWRHVVPLVEGRALAWEMVGYGDSIAEGRGRDISVARQADYLLAWLDHLGIHTAFFVGHDLGGGVLQIAATRAPERFAGLVLTNSIAYDSWPIPSVKAMRAIAPLFARTPQPLFRASLAALMLRGHDNSQQASEALNLHLGPYRQHDGAGAMARQVQALDVQDTLAVAPLLPSLDIPTRIVWGAADRFQKIRYAERLAADLDAPLDRIGGGKHFTPEDHPDRVATAVNSLTRDRPSLAPG